jgi:hypothetical protein
MKYRPKAQIHFENGLTLALELRQFAAVEMLFTQYGYYLELTDDDPYGDAMEVMVEFVPSKPDYSRLPEWEMPAFEWTPWPLQPELLYLPEEYYKKETV